MEKGLRTESDPSYTEVNVLKSTWGFLGTCDVYTKEDVACRCTFALNLSNFWVVFFLFSGLSVLGSLNGPYLNCHAIESGTKLSSPLQPRKWPSLPLFDLLVQWMMGIEFLESLQAVAYIDCRRPLIHIDASLHVWMFFGHGAIWPLFSFSIKSQGTWSNLHLQVHLSIMPLLQASFHPLPPSSQLHYHQWHNFLLLLAGLNYVV